MVWLWPWLLRRLIVVHDAFASRGIAEEQIAFFGMAQARVGVLSAEVSAVARRLARARAKGAATVLLFTGTHPTH